MALASRSKRSLNCGIGEFDRDVPVQTRVPGAIHLSHAARAEERKDFVRAEFITGRKRHMADSPV